MLVMMVDRLTVILLSVYYGGPVDVRVDVGGDCSVETVIYFSVVFSVQWSVRIIIVLPSLCPEMTREAKVMVRISTPSHLSPGSLSILDTHHQQPIRSFHFLR